MSPAEREKMFCPLIRKVLEKGFPSEPFPLTGDRSESLENLAFVRKFCEKCGKCTDDDLDDFEYEDEDEDEDDNNTSCKFDFYDEYKMYCPVLNEEIDGGTCLDIELVANGKVDPIVLPENIVWNEEQRQKCLSCMYHYNEQSDE